MRASLGLLLFLAFVPPTSAARQRVVRHPVPLDAISRVFVVVLENTDGVDAVRQPFIARLIREGTYLRNYHGITHPSQPNYIAMVSGSLHGVTTNDSVIRDVHHLGDLLEAKNRSWKTYAENYPGGCFVGANADGALYARRHVPFLTFANVQFNGSRCSSHIVNATAFQADVAAGSLADYSLYIPNNDNNGHDTSVAFADRWLENTFAPLLSDPRFTAGLLLVVTFDEGSRTADNHVATVLWGPQVSAGVVSDVRYDHYNLLHTIELLLGTATTGYEDAVAAPIAEVLSGRRQTPDSDGISTKRPSAQTPF